MKLNLNQTKLVGFTMELDLKAKEYRTLCDKLEQLKQSDINPNDPSLMTLLEEFKKNNDEIRELNKQLKSLETEE